MDNARSVKISNIMFTMEWFVIVADRNQVEQTKRVNSIGVRLFVLAPLAAAEQMWLPSHVIMQVFCMARRELVKN